MTKEIIENDPYKTAGVDIDAGNTLVDKIKKKVIDQGIKFITKIDQSSEDGILNILNDISIKSQNINEDINNEIKPFINSKF